MIVSNRKVALVTGAAGFIGFHISKRLLDDGWRVVGLDCMSLYYDISLKKDRESQLISYKSYRSVHKDLEDGEGLRNLFSEEQPAVVIHLAAQAGVRYSIDNPRSYLESNIIGTFELLEAAKEFSPDHMLIASTSSVYGANEKMPYSEFDKADHQMSFYAATKKSTENICHSYSHLYNLPTTVFRFFTVYGPWGRPDMALFKFTKAILNSDPINVYNHGKMKRDFTYIDDLINAVRMLIDVIPKNTPEIKFKDSKSSVAPFRVVNIGNSQPQNLMDFIKEIEAALGIKAKKNFLPMQAGDVQATWASNELLLDLLEMPGTTSITDGVKNFVYWYKDYYKVFD
tara:strand:- start:664 stop:1689 length:1026 start_codon:yes stop_codon:yes gene_type:complete